jgi:hypothetical protein
MLTGCNPVNFYLRAGNVRTVSQDGTRKPEGGKTPNEN